MTCIDIEEGKNLGGEQGYVYLIHFDKPFHHARHYLGWTKEDVEAQLDKHVRGFGSKLLRAVGKVGIDIHVCRVWNGVMKLITLRARNEVLSASRRAMRDLENRVCEYHDQLFDISSFDRRVFRTLQKAGYIA